MDKEKLLELTTDVEAWNEFRRRHPEVPIDFSFVDFTRADLSGANLSLVDLAGANLSGANLAGATLYQANLTGANLTGSNLSRANLCGANLYGSNLSGANLRGATLSWAVGNGAEIKSMQIGLSYVVYTWDRLWVGLRRGLISDWKQGVVPLTEAEKDLWHQHGGFLLEVISKYPAVKEVTM